MTATLTHSALQPMEESRVISLVTQPKGQVLFAFLALCAITILNSFFYFYRPYDGLELYREVAVGEVYEIHPGSPAEKAGVQVGDLVMAIDGRPLDASLGGPQYKAGIKPGEELLYELRRGDQEVGLTIQIGSLWENPAWLASYLGIQILSYGSWGVGLVLTLFLPGDDQRARLLGLGFLLAGIAVAAGGAGGWNSFWGANSLQLVLWSLMAWVIVAAHLSFPAISFPKHRLSINRIFLGVSLGLAGLVMIETWNLASLSDSFPVGLRRQVFIYFMIAWGISIGLMIRNRFRSSDLEIQRQTGIILWGMTLGLGPFFVLTLLPYLLLGTETVSGTYTILFLLILPLSYAYVLFQRRLIRVDLIINRLLVFFVLLLLSCVAWIILFGLVAQVLDFPTELAFLGGLLVALITLPATSAFKPVQKKVNQVLYGSHYDYSTVTSSLSSQLARTLDRGKLIHLMTDDLSRQMGIERAELFLTDSENYLSTDDGNESGPLALRDELTGVFQRIQTPVLAVDLRRMIPGEAHKAWERFHWGQIFAPLLFENKLHGILVLGRRTSGDIYSDQDLQIISTVASQGALASANVYLVEELRGLTKDLVWADEAARKSLARDLHDSVLQNLVFIKQRMLAGHDSGELSRHLDQVVAELRGVIKSQRPPLLDQGLVLALEGLVFEMQKITGLTPEIVWQTVITGHLGLSDERATSVYRIAQEAINNALKHAHAGRIDVKMERVSESVLRLIVKDDGVGITKAVTGRGIQEGRFGLVGMRERAGMIDASLEIKSLQGGGTAIVLEFSP